MADKGLIERKSYGKIAPAIEMPNLLDIQIDSYTWFLQKDESPGERKLQGLQAVFHSIFPITDVHNLYSLEFVDYSIGTPKYEVSECLERGTSYAAPLRATLRLVSREKQDGEEPRVKDIVEQTVFLGELPLMAEEGTFIINGSERVIVSQLHRSPGVFFDETIHPNGKRLYSARIIPY
ncbi:MAG: DNA-directed RNA polymerase subunit beta, partial [bacterium]|nr:DNA-directed RNA polymerase subunit beta [bacterium]